MHLTSGLKHLDPQVDAFLEAHDSGLSEADKAVANGGFLTYLRFL